MLVRAAEQEDMTAPRNIVIKTYIILLIENGTSLCTDKLDAIKILLNTYLSCEVSSRV